MTHSAAHLLGRGAEQQQVSAAASASRGSKVHSTWPGPHSFSIERSGRSIFS
jgi:hypothetical protein